MSLSVTKDLLFFSQITIRDVPKNRIGEVRRTIGKKQIKSVGRYNSVLIRISTIIRGKRKREKKKGKGEKKRGKGEKKSSGANLFFV